MRALLIALLLVTRCALAQLDDVAFVASLSAPLATSLISTNTGPWVYGGGVSTFATSGNVSGGTGSGRTFVVNSLSARIRKPGTVYAAAMSCQQLGNPNNSIKFKVFRLNGSNYDLVGQSEVCTVTGTGSNYYTLSTPISGCREGDIPGIYLTNNPATVLGLYVSTGTGYYASGDVTGANQTINTSAGGIPTIKMWMDAPVISYHGDSIIAGHNNGTGNFWTPYLDGGPTGTILSSIPYCNSTNGGSLVQYCNYGKGAMGFIWIATNTVSLATNDSASVAWIHCGLNDIASKTWSQILTNLTDIRNAWPTQKPLFISEILPWTAGTDGNSATLRTWNTNLSLWCGTNNATIATLHDAFGETRPSTGFLDNLKSEYTNSTDQVHLNQAGVSNYVYMMSQYLNTVIAHP